jgi:peptidoglycan DL-endopeptidase CwlO
MRVRSRGTTRPPLVAAVMALIATLVVSIPTPSGAGSISQTQKEIAQLSAALSRQEQRSEITANEYDADKAAVQGFDASIAALQSQEVQKRRSIAVTSRQLVAAVVRAYVFGAAQAQIIAIFDQSVTSSDARQIYEERVVGSLNALRQRYAAERASLQRTVRHVANQRAQKEAATLAAKQLLAQNIHLADQTQATLATVTAELRSQIIAYEITAGAAAARAHNTAGEEQAINAASAVGGQSAANQVIEAIQAATTTVTIAEVAGTAQGKKAVAEAESQIGVPYVWGGETPGVGFDCSGLVQWAWARAGITLPRTTETQWPDMVHVPLTDLQPGDLLFYFNLDGDHAVDHVVMYVGSGPWGVDTTIAAAHSGTDVALAPLFTAGLIGAARP